MWSLEKLKKKKPIHSSAFLSEFLSAEIADVTSLFGFKELDRKVTFMSRHVRVRAAELKLCVNEFTSKEFTRA